MPPSTVLLLRALRSSAICSALRRQASTIRPSSSACSAPSRIRDAAMCRCAHGLLRSRPAALLVLSHASQPAGQRATQRSAIRAGAHSRTRSACVGVRGRGPQATGLQGQGAHKHRLRLHHRVRCGTLISARHCHLPGDGCAPRQRAQHQAHTKQSDEDGRIRHLKLVASFRATGLQRPDEGSPSPRSQPPSCGAQHSALRPRRRRLLLVRLTCAVRWA